ncbi:hypothetical protein ACI7BZ_09470 [Xanthobacter sp. AM11]|uniref:hypothetical protein n=1 Tax=Xanthobacter sp. AM11 TaxID=3380643 RepID=UPI0039BFF323
MLRALLLWLAVLATATHAAPEDAGAPVAVEGLAAGDSRNLALAAPPGAYVEGEMEVARGRFRLDLKEAGGRHLRRLEADLAGRATFRFIAPAPGAQLVVTALEPDAAARLSLRSQTAPAQPKAAGAPLLSPAVAALALSLDAGCTTDAFWQDMARRGTPLIEPAPPGAPPG